MLNTNYAKLVGGYLEYLRLPVELQSPLIINGVRCVNYIGGLMTNGDNFTNTNGVAPAFVIPLKTPYNTTPNTDGSYNLTL